LGTLVAETPVSGRRETGVPQTDVPKPQFGNEIKRYVDSLSGYKKNPISELAADMRERIAREWQRCFDEWAYVP
jgi:hypothetical protein